ncbi:MAG: IPT/TIG domain-containing protein [Myxococcales bacterium]|nr:IPT/TIG domain-containing protein [Polyangiaceae bacterium]MDW8251236.1 IPT/TIG domain-containing protein [Myxococcales bacterium]
MPLLDRKKSLLGGASLVLLGVACLPTRPEGELRRVIDEPDAGPVGPVEVPTTGGGGNGQAPADPHGLVGVDPSHGRFTGGMRAVLQGSGFAKKPRVWFGTTEVPPGDVVAISTKKIQVVTPPGVPGPVEVRVQNGDDTSTQRVLPGGYTYDAFYAEPDSGPTSGGTQLRILGSGTSWSKGTQVKIGDKPCEGVQVLGPTELVCTTVAAAPGARSLTVIDADGTATSVLDAFVYADSDNGFRGGLSGDPLPTPPAEGQPPIGSLRVLAFDSYTGAPLVGARVFVGTNQVGVLGASGVIQVDGVIDATTPKGPSGAPRLTVTVAKKCSKPTTFAGVSVDTVTMYLDPVLSPDCAPPEGNPPPTGGKPSIGTSVSGEVRFPSDVEFKQSPWSTVPAPVSPGERRVAYIFNTTTDPRAAFKLPDASQAITEESAGTIGYSFSFSSSQVGNLTLYALAGIENRTKVPPTFTAYAFGVARGVSTKPGEVTEEVTMVIDSTLDQSVTLQVEPPVPGAKGPDQLQVTVALSLGHAGFAIFPGAQKTLPMPVQGDLTFVGLPPLINSLAGLRYVATAMAGTGPQLLLPVASAGSSAFQDTSKPLLVDGFVHLPRLKIPGASLWDGVTYQLDDPGGGVPPDLILYDVSSGGGLVNWTIVTPGDMSGVVVPDLRKIPGAGLVPGPVTMTVSAAKLPDFSYHALRYRDLNRTNWRAYAQDVFYTQLSP